MENGTEPVLINNTFKDKTKIFFIKKYSLFTKLTVYLITILILIISVILCSKNYVKYQKIYLAPVQSVNLNEFMENNNVTISDDKISMVFTPLKFNQLLKSELQNLKIDSLKENKILDLQYDSNSKRIFLNVQDQKKNTYSFSSKVNMKVNNTQLLLNLSDYRLGKYKSRILGNYYKFSLGLPKTINLFSTNKNNLLVIKDIRQSSASDLEMSYSYNYDEFIKKFTQYKDQVDDLKIKLYEKNGKISPEIINIFTTGEINKDKVDKGIKLLEQNSNSLEQFTLLLNEQGIKTICADLKNLYSKNVNVDRLVEKSDNAIDKNLNKYHYDFSRMLLNYLYTHRDYTVTGESIYIDGTALTADKILNENNYTKSFDVDIISNSNSISAVYTIGNKTISKTVLRKE
ncbi:hypothetical protein [Clostridium sp.]